MVTSNSILVITPCSHNGLWVFDGPNAGLVREPFVAGAPSRATGRASQIEELDEYGKLKTIRWIGQESAASTIEERLELRLSRRKQGFESPRERQ